MSLPSPLLQVNELSVAFQGHPILRQLSLTLNARDYVSIIGPNGAGKSTLLKTILGIHTHFQGRIALQGRPLASLSAKARARLMAYVPQSQPMDEFCSVYEFVALGRYAYTGRFHGLRDEDRQKIQTALAHTRLTAFADRKLSTLSGGERQNALIAAALCQEPNLLVLDEPTTFLDPKNQAGLHHLLREIHHHREIAILAVTHDIQAALQTSTRLVGLKAGQIQFEGTPEQWRDPVILERLFDIPFQSCQPEPNAPPLVWPQWLLQGDDWQSPNNHPEATHCQDNRHAD
jgi:ABC-type cobalamin/Fe3+-siderophores transport system ATPase subunit